MEKEEAVTLWSCHITEESIAASLCAGQQEAWDERERELDLEDRLQAPRCERCGEESGQMLTLSAGEALCDGCLSWEFPAPSEEPEPSTAFL